MPDGTIEAIDRLFDFVDHGVDHVERVLNRGRQTAERHRGRKQRRVGQAPAPTSTARKPSSAPAVRRRPSRESRGSTSSRPSPPQESPNLLSRTGAMHGPLARLVSLPSKSCVPWRRTRERQDQHCTPPSSWTDGLRYSGARTSHEMWGRVSDAPDPEAIARLKSRAARDSWRW